jgi:Ca2+-binding EF-hand superfamily protein
MDLKRAIGAALAAGVFVATPVIATDASSNAGSASSYFDSLDKNNDGKLVPAELQSIPAVQKNFSKYDHNRNGSLGKDEFAEALSAERVALPGSSAVAGATGDPSRQFDSLDKNKDGKLDPSELQAVPAVQKNFSKYDHDRNGTLGKDEFREALSATQGSPSAAAGASSNPSFDSLDKNKDGKLDPSELQAIPALQKNFSKYDHDRNGTLGKDEFREALSAGGATPR